MFKKINHSRFWGVLLVFCFLGVTVAYQNCGESEYGDGFSQEKPEVLPEPALTRVTGSGEEAEQLSLWNDDKDKLVHIKWRGSSADWLSYKLQICMVNPGWARASFCADYSQYWEDVVINSPSNIDESFSCEVVGESVQNADESYTLACNLDVQLSGQDYYFRVCEEGNCLPQEWSYTAEAYRFQLSPESGATMSMKAWKSKENVLNLRIKKHRKTGRLELSWGNRYCTPEATNTRVSGDRDWPCHKRTLEQNLPHGWWAQAPRADADKVGRYVIYRCEVDDDNTCKGENFKARAMVAPPGVLTMNPSPLGNRFIFRDGNAFGATVEDPQADYNFETSGVYIYKIFAHNELGTPDAGVECASYRPQGNEDGRHLSAQGRRRCLSEGRGLLAP